MGGEDQKSSQLSPPAFKRRRTGEEECQHDLCSIAEIQDRKMAAVEKNSEVDPEHSETDEELQYLLDHISRNPIIMTQVFHHLAPQDIKSVALVSRSWRRLVEKPRFWRWAHTRISGRDFSKKYKSPRIRNIGSVQLDVSEVKIKKFFSSLENFRLGKLDVGYVNLASVCPEVLSLEIIRREEVKFCLCSLQPDQVNAIFTKTAKHQAPRLRELHINFTDISSVPCDLLSLALLRLSALHLWQCLLSADQVKAVFKSILDTPDLRLTDLTLNTSDFSSVTPSILSRAILRLESVNLSYTELSPEQLDSIFRDIIECDKFKLNTLKLLASNVSSVSAETLSRALVKLESVDLTKTSLSPDQLEALFATIVATPDLRLRTLNIGGNDLSSVSPVVLSEAIVRLKEVKLKDTKLTEDQLNAVFQTFVESEGEEQRCLHIGGGEYSSVSGDLVSRLEEKLAHCHLTNTWCLKG